MEKILVVGEARMAIFLPIPCSKGRTFCHVCTIRTDIHSTLLEIRQSDSTGNKEDGSCLL